MTFTNFQKKVLESVKNGLHGFALVKYVKNELTFLTERSFRPILHAEYNVFNENQELNNLIEDQIPQMEVYLEFLSNGKIRFQSVDYSSQVIISSNLEESKSLKGYIHLILGSTDTSSSASLLIVFNGEDGYYVYDTDSELTHLIDLAKKIFMKGNVK
jgi:DUF1365 family protein